MISLSFILLFIFCLAIAVASILVSHQFINTYNTDFHKNYFYYLVSFYAFALYGIWGQILVRALLSSFDSGVKVIETVANFLPVLGVPFLFISWIMLINMAYSMFNEKAHSRWIFFHLGIFTLLLFASWIVYALLKSQPDLIHAYLKYFEVGIILGFEFVYLVAFLIILKLKRRTNDIATPYLMRFAMLLFGAFILRSSMLPVGFLNVWFLVIAILIFFSSNFIPLFYLSFNSDHIFTPVKADHASDDKMNRMFKKYRITKREREIVMQICEGKTNQQIADELFISLQTVKDHTHRIYSKIGINSRMQLVQKVNL